MTRVCSWCRAEVRSEETVMCPVCGESLSAAVPVPEEPPVPIAPADPPVEAPTQPPRAASPSEPPVETPTQPPLAPPPSEPPVEAPTQPPIPAAAATPAPTADAGSSVAAPPVPASPTAPSESAAAAVPADPVADARTPPPAATRLTCRHCGAFVEAGAGQECPVCFESTTDAVAVPWNPPRPEVAAADSEAAPMQVSALRVPASVIEAAGVPVPPRDPALEETGEVRLPPPTEPKNEPTGPSRRRETPFRGDRPSSTRNRVVDAPSREIPRVPIDSDFRGPQLPPRQISLRAALVMSALIAAVAFALGLIASRIL